MRLCFFIFLFTFLGHATSAQYNNPICRYTSYGLSGKVSYFEGDVKSPIPYVNGGFGLSVNRRVSPRVTLFSEFSVFRIAGDDNKGSGLRDNSTINSYIRNLSFRNDIKQLSIGLKYDLFPSNDHYRKRPVYNIYGTIGLVFLHHNPKTKIFKDSTNTSTKWINLKPLHTEDRNYSNFQLGIPAGLGIRYKLSLQLDLEIELTYQYVLSDYLDDVSGNYVDPSELQSEEARKLANRSAEAIAVGTGDMRELEYIQNTLKQPIVNAMGYSYVDGTGPGTSRGSKAGNDGIVLVSFRLLYTFPGKINCPKYREL